jgi:hypothetical protein
MEEDIECERKSGRGCHAGLSGFVRLCSLAQTSLSGEAVVRCGALHLCDLAGSERLDRSHANLVSAAAPYPNLNIKPRERRCSLP